MQEKKENRKVRLGLFLRDTPRPQQQETDVSESGKRMIPYHTSPELVKLKGGRVGVVVADDGVRTRTCFMRVTPPFVRDDGKVSPGRVTTVGVYHAECEWCGDFVSSAGELTKKAADKKGYDPKGGMRGVMSLLSRCPDCGKPFRVGWHAITPDHPKGQLVFPGTPGFVQECIEKTRAATAPFELPAMVGAYPIGDGYSPRAPYTQRERFGRAQSFADSISVKMKSGRLIHGLSLVDAEQLPQPASRPIGWFLLFGGTSLVGIADWNLVDGGWRCGVNFKFDIRVFLGDRGGGRRDRRAYKVDGDFYI